MIKNFLIVSTGRTGTLSLSKSITGKNTEVYHEKFPNAREISRKRWDNIIHKNDLLKETKNSFDSFFNKKEIIIDSNSLTWNIIDIIESTSKGNICYIHIFRDREETIDSMMRTDCYGKNKMPWSLREHRFFYDIRNANYDVNKQRKNCEMMFDIRNESIIRSLSTIDNERILKVDFSKLIREEKEIMKIENFLSRYSDENIRIHKLKHEHKTK